MEVLCLLFQVCACLHQYGCNRGNIVIACSVSGACIITAAYIRGNIGSKWTAMAPSDHVFLCRIAGQVPFIYLFMFYHVWHGHAMLLTPGS